MIKLLKINTVNSKYIVEYSNNNEVKTKELDSLEEVANFLRDAGYYISGIEYKFPNQPKEFTENVTIVGNKHVWPEITIEKVNIPSGTPLFYPR